jgi:protein-disulfide isomerase
MTAPFGKQIDSVTISGSNLIKRGETNMKSALFNRVALITVVSTSIMLTGITQASAQTIVKTKVKTPATRVSKVQREAIESIIRDYLLSNPSIIREATQALQVQEEKERQQLAAANLKTLEADIYSDPDSPVGGNAKGDVTVVVFFDYNCGYCKTTVPALEGLLEKDPSIRLVYKEFPILGPQSQTSALAALAAARQGKYTEFHQALMLSEGGGENVIKDISDRLGLDFAVLQKDMGDPKLQAALDRNIRVAIRVASTLGINGTPGYIVGSQIIPGAIDIASLEMLIAGERAKKETAIPTGELAGALK